VEEGEGTTFMQWRERVHSEAREDDRPQFRAILITATAVAGLAIVLGAIVFALS
jgi:hypothetical protein